MVLIFRKAIHSFENFPATSINNSRCEHKHAETMKVNKVIGSFENGDRNEPEIFCPLSLLTAIIKNFMQLLMMLITQFVTNHEAFTSLFLVSDTSEQTQSVR